VIPNYLQEAEAEPEEKKSGKTNLYTVKPQHNQQGSDAYYQHYSQSM